MRGYSTRQRPKDDATPFGVRPARNCTYLLYDANSSKLQCQSKCSGGLTVPHRQACLSASGTLLYWYYSTSFVWPAPDQIGEKAELVEASPGGSRHAFDTYSANK